MVVLLFVLASIVFMVVVLLATSVFVHNEVDRRKQYRYVTKTHFFNRSEQQFFNILNAKLDAQRFTIFPKVRLGDIVSVVDQHVNSGGWAKVRARHVDFLIWDLKAQRIACAIELDGPSHANAKAQVADAFKNEVFSSLNFALYRVRVGSNFYQEIDLIVSRIAV